jgi:hypothetical protein
MGVWAAMEDRRRSGTFQERRRHRRESEREAVTGNCLHGHVVYE